MQLQCKETKEMNPHPAGVHSAVCVDVLDLGLVQTVYNGVPLLVPKLRLVFETEVVDEQGKRHILARKCRASLHPRSTLHQFISNWRGRAIAPGETVDLEKLVGVSCTLSLSHRLSLTGRVWVSIDSIARPTRKVTPSGGYDRAEARRKLEEWKAGIGVHGSLLMANGRNMTGNETGHPRLVVLGGAEDVGF